MVENCPNPNCRFELEKELDKMVTKASVWKFVSIFGVIILIGVVAIYARSNQNSERIAVNERVLQERTANILLDMSSIKSTLSNSTAEIKSMIKEQIVESKEARAQIHKRITEECRPTR